ncbi:MAG: penicillin-binding protein activator [Nevskiaceae bacterium]|nr:MAG: penicillin-binding protein activator [Nevskiaceae bacterium]
MRVPGRRDATDADVHTLTRMNIRIRFRRAALLAVLLAFSGVASADPLSAPGAAARQALQRGDYAEASRAFEAAARDFPSSFTPEFLLSAAEAAQKAGDAPRAQRLIRQIPDNSLDAGQLTRLQALNAALASPAAPAPAAAPEAVAPAAGTVALPGIGTATGGGIALLLPLNGPLATSAGALRDGFVAADTRNGSHHAVRVYDSGDSADAALAAYQQALRDGAQLVVGPLRKDAVAAIAALGQPAVPVLALNYLDDTAKAPFHLFQYGLAPEDEARAAAERAVADGGKRAIALVPRSEWGERVLAALDKRLRDLGGAVLKSARYAPGDTDYGKTIQDLLNLDASDARHKALTGILGEKTEFEQRRRDDIDFIFFAARPSDARMIWPQFRYYRATGLPVYATSLVYDGGGDNELNGVRFCDMPWMLQNDGAVATLRTELAASQPAAKSQPRLFAMGLDAYALSTMLLAGQVQTGTIYPAATGGLRMAPDGAIARTLSCAQFRDGGVRSLDPAATP